MLLNGDMEAWLVHGRRFPENMSNMHSTISRDFTSHLALLDCGRWKLVPIRRLDSYINLDAHYVDNWSMWLDLKILLKTVSVVIAGTGQ